MSEANESLEARVGEMIMAVEPGTGTVVTWNLSATFNSYTVYNGVWEPVDTKTRYLPEERMHPTAGDVEAARAFAEEWLQEIGAGPESE